MNTTGKSVKILAPTGCLGYGFSVADYRRCVQDFRPDVIGVDAGSTDPGPYYLGAGTSFTSRYAVRAELDVILGEALPLGIPVVVGNAGGAGGVPHTRWVEAIITELAAERGWKFNLTVIDSEVSPTQLHDLISRDRIQQFESGTDLTHQMVDDARRIVGQLGPEPLADALASGADVVVAGRVCDDAIFAAYPLSIGADRGLSTFAGKVLECGALACEPIAMDVLLAEVHGDHVLFEPGSLSRCSTVASVTGHSLYERENPYIQAGPGGSVDLSQVQISSVDERTVKVSNVTFVPADYTIKLEGVRSVGYRAISIAGVADPRMIDDIDSILSEAKRRSLAHLAQAGIEPKYLNVRVYGRDAVPLVPHESQAAAPAEVGLLIEAICPTQEEALAACHELSGTLLHIDFPGQVNTAGNLAFPYSPSDVDAGEVFEFSIYHLALVDHPDEFSRSRTISIGGH